MTFSERLSRVLKMEKQLLSVDTAQANGLHLTPLIRKPTFLTKNLRLLIQLAYVIMSQQTFLLLPLIRLNFWKLKKNNKDLIQKQILNDLNYITTEDSSTHYPMRKGNISENLNIQAASIADRKIATYIYTTKQSFNSCDTLAFLEMIKSVINAGPGYNPPKSSVISGRLLDEQYKIVKETNSRLIDQESILGHGMTLSSDSATITKQPLTNYICKFPNKPGISLGYDDATSIYQAGGIKDANAVYDGLKNKIEEVGPANVTAVVLDNAPVMLAALAMLSILYTHLIVLGNSKFILYNILFICLNIYFIYLFIYLFIILYRLLSS